MQENLNEFKVWKPEYYLWIWNFVNDKEQIRLFSYVDTAAEEIKFSVYPPQFYDLSKKEQEDFQIVYFLKKNVITDISMENIDESITIGVVDGDPLDDLLNKMNSNFLNDKNAWSSWPEGVWKEFISGLHWFMAALTEASH